MLGIGLGTVANSERQLVAFKKIAETANLLWKNPHVATSCQGEVVFEWWSDDRKLSIYVEEDAVDFIKVWGDGDMDDGPVEDFEKLLRWLIDAAGS